MPSKAKRVASRQGQLSRRKQKGRGPTTPEQMLRQESMLGSAITVPTKPDLEKSKATEPETEIGSLGRQNPRRPLQAVSSSRTSSYLKRELVQVGAVSGFTFLVLFITFFMFRSV